MKVAVVGLGTEGNFALHSLLNYGHYVYASDLNKDLVISINKFKGKFEIELGSHNWDKINDADAVVISPSMWRENVLEKVASPDKILSRVCSKHRDIFTIGVTGTNGKTTTSLMIRDILKNAGFKVLIGGNAGGGFEGYTKLMLEASQDNYDYLIVEVCDMTLNFSSDNFEFDLMVVTNLGWDHINVHHTMEKYQESMRVFLQDKKAVLNKNDELLSNLGKNPYFYGTYQGELNLMGNYNRQNAAAAFKVGEILDVPGGVIEDSLAAFKPVEGRIAEIIHDDTRIVIGKTDNISALTAVLKEVKFDAAILGTPRKTEYWRFNIFQKVVDFNPQFIGLFSGLDDTTAPAKDVLLENGYQGEIKIFHDTSEILKFISSPQMKYETVFIGGNGQKKIMEIKKGLEKIFN